MFKFIKNHKSYVLSVILVAALFLPVFKGSGAALPAGNVRCYFYEPTDGSAYFFSQYPIPASYSGKISVNLTGKAGDPVPVTDFNLKWSAVKDLGDYRFEYLKEADGYSAVLSSLGDGGSVPAISPTVVPLVSSYSAKASDKPVKHTLEIKKAGQTVTSCSVDVSLSVNWSTNYTAPTTAQPTGDTLFPYTLKSITGLDYKNLAFPTSLTSPLKLFTGRYYDGYPHGAQTTSMGFYWRHLAGGDDIRVTGTRVYARLGSTIVAYNKSSFITSLASPLSVFKGTYAPNLGYNDALRPWATYFYPEDVRSTGWVAENCDCNENLRAFDVDDRGYLYLGHLFGIGIIKDNGTKLVPVSQIRGISGLIFSDGPKTLPFVKTGSLGSNKITDAGTGGNIQKGLLYIRSIKVGAKYYVEVSDTPGSSQFFDVTDPLNPQFSGSGSGSRVFAQSGSVIATLSPISGTGSASLRLYSASNYVAGLAPNKEFTVSGTYEGLAGDKTSGKFYSLAYDAGTANMSVLTPGLGKTAESYTEAKKPLNTASVGTDSNRFKVESMEYSNGFITSIGILPSGAARDIKIWVMRSGSPVEISTGGFAPNYYGGNIIYANVFTLGTKDYLFVSNYEMGDVYELNFVSRDGSTGVTPPTGTTPGSGDPTLGSSCYLRYPTNLQLRALCEEIEALKDQVCRLNSSFSFCAGRQL